MANYYKYKRSGYNGYLWEFKAYLGKDSITGKDVRISRRRDSNNNPFETKREAMDEVSRLKAEFNQKGKKKKEKEKEGYSFEEVYYEWLNGQYAGTVRESTLSRTKGFFNKYILPELGHKKVDKLTVRDCDMVVQNWADDGDLSEYKRLVHYVIRVLDYSIYIGYSDENPMQKIRIPDRTTATKPTKVEYLNRDELTEFLDECKRYGSGNKWYTYFRLLSYTGCRKSEALALNWDDINWEDKEISFSKTLSKVSGSDVRVSDSTKNGKSRIVPIDDKTLSTLKEHKQNISSMMVFPADKDNSKYTHPDLPNTVMTRILERIPTVDKNVTPHNLRHTHASLLFEAGLAIKDVQNRLGHSSADITMDIYTHVSSDRERLAIDVFDKYMNPG